MTSLLWQRLEPSLGGSMVDVEEPAEDPALATHANQMLIQLRAKMGRGWTRL